jgi:hypothetical protein
VQRRTEPVVVNLLKVEGGQEGDSKSASVWHYGDRGLFET